MNTDTFQTNIKTKASRAIGQANINAKSLAETGIPLPPLEVQQDIIKQIQEEAGLVKADQRLIEIFEQKIKNKLSEIWEGKLEEVVEGVISSEQNATTGELEEKETEKVEIRQGALFLL